MGCPKSKDVKEDREEEKIRTRLLRSKKLRKIMSKTVKKISFAMSRFQITSANNNFSKFKNNHFSSMNTSNRSWMI
jgi:hypothetical protein